jgi:hypothetical protein
MLVEQIINERYVNAVGFTDSARAIKMKYRDEVWKILQQSYASIGGIKGAGFESPDAMVDSIPMWKIAVRDGRVRAVNMYKDKGGRKSVAIGTDGSPEGSAFVDDMFRNEIHRSYGEKSKAALGKMLKTIPWPVLKNYVISPDRVAEMMPEDRIIPLAEVDPKEWPADAAMTVGRFPHLKPYGYMRDLGGELVFKIMIGTPGKHI